MTGWPLHAVEALKPLHLRQQALAIGIAAVILVLVVELVRRRKLREEFAWVWIAVSALLSAAALSESLVAAVSDWIGSTTAISTLFFGAILFLLLLSLQLSVRLSKLTHRHRTLAQRMALLEAELQALRQGSAPKQERQPAPSAPELPAPPAVEPRLVRAREESA